METVHPWASWTSQHQWGLRDSEQKKPWSQPPWSVRRLWTRPWATGRYGPRDTLPSSPIPGWSAYVAAAGTVGYWQFFREILSGERLCGWKELLAQSHIPFWGNLQRRNAHSVEGLVNSRPLPQWGPALKTLEPELSGLRPLLQPHLLHRRAASPCAHRWRPWAHPTNFRLWVSASAADRPQGIQTCGRDLKTWVWIGALLISNSGSRSKFPLSKLTIIKNTSWNCLLQGMKWIQSTQ